MADLTAGDLLSLLDSWLLRMAAERKSAATLDSYRQSVEQYLASRKIPTALEIRYCRRMR